MSYINEVYAYFKSIGIDQHQHNKWVTTSLALVPKPSLFQQICSCKRNSRDTNIPKVIGSLDAMINEVEDPDTSKMASFIKGVLENCREKRDPHLSNLGRLNALFNGCTGLFDEKDELLKKYFVTGRVDETAQSVRKIKASGCGPLQNLCQDMTAKVFSFLSLKDQYNAGATCWNWHRAAERPDSFDMRSLTPKELLYVSTLPSKTIRAFKEHRRFIEEFKKASLAREVISSESIASDSIFQYQPGPNDPILIRKQNSIYIVNTKRSIEHNFSNRYELLYEKSLHKIFVIDRENNTIHGLYEIDPETGHTLPLFKQDIQVNGLFHIAYQENKIWIITALGAAHVYDRETKKLYEQAWEVKPSAWFGLHHFMGLDHIFTSAGLPSTFEVQNLNTPAVSHIVPGSEVAYSLVAKTHEALFVSMSNGTRIVALDPSTGHPLQTFICPSLFPLWYSPYAHVSSGMLYISTSPYKTEAYDILTGKHLRTISFGWFEKNSYLEVFNNKLVYRVGNEIRMISAL